MAAEGSRAALVWRRSNTMGASFCLSGLDEATARLGKLEVFTTDQGSQFTRVVFAGTPLTAGIEVSMDGRGRGTDDVFIERLRRSLKHEDAYLKGYVDGHEARARIAAWVGFYNLRLPHWALGYRTPMRVWRSGVTGDVGGTAVDMAPCLDNAAAFPTLAFHPLRERNLGQLRPHAHSRHNSSHRLLERIADQEVGATANPTNKPARVVHLTGCTSNQAAPRVDKPPPQAGRPLQIA